MKLMSQKFKKSLAERGDTIVEVLIAIAIASFAVGLSYSTAEHSLQQAISAREHNEALDILESQLADLNFRFQKLSTQAFNTQFASQHNFCLSDTATDPSMPGWGPDPTHQNNPVSPSSAPAFIPTGPYASGCEKTEVGGGANYFFNINPNGVVGTTIGVPTNPTLYDITVRWYRVGGGVNQASLYYKLNNSASGSLGYAAPNTSNQIATLPPFIKKPELG